jgi:PAS domain S-box-containing protein
MDIAMKNCCDKTEKSVLLRRKAEELLKRNDAKTSLPHTETETLTLVNELAVHQIELELQNEELTLAKQRADESAEMFSQLYDYAPVGYFTLSKEGKILRSNLAGAKMLGKERAQIKNIRFEYFVSGDTKTALNTFLEKLFRGEPNQSSEATLIRENQEPMHVQLAGVVTKNSGECFVTAVDIGERKLAETEITRSREKYKKLSLLKKAILESPEGIIFFALDKEYRYMDFSKLHQRTMKEIWGVDIAVGTNMLHVITQGQDCQKAKMNFDKVLAGESFVIEEEYGNEKLKRTYYENRYSPIRHEDNSIRGVSVFVIDITERKHAEVLLENEHLRLQGIIEGANIGTWEWNIQTGEAVFNKKWFEMNGYTLNELSPVSIATWQSHIHPDDVKKSATLLEQHFKGERQYYVCEYRMKHRDGTWVWILDRGCVITRTKEGKPLMMFGTHTDITRRKYDEEERERLIAELQSALAEVKTLTGIIPICANCKKIRDDEGFWEQVESYVSQHTNAQFSHGICPACVGKLYPTHTEKILNRAKV